MNSLEDKILFFFDDVKTLIPFSQGDWAARHRQQIRELFSLMTKENYNQIICTLSVVAYRIQPIIEPILLECFFDNIEYSTLPLDQNILPGSIYFSFSTFLKILNLVNPTNNSIISTLCEFYASDRYGKSSQPSDLCRAVVFLEQQKKYPTESDMNNILKTISTTKEFDYLFDNYPQLVRPLVSSDNLRWSSLLMDHLIKLRLLTPYREMPLRKKLKLI